MPLPSLASLKPSRGNAYLQQHSGLVHGDLDDVGDVEAVKRALADDRRTVYVFISPSANGVKVGVHVPIVDDDAAYKHAWQAVATEYERLYGVRWDPSGKDISRLCYISNDPDLYMNLDAEEFNIPPAPVLEPRPPQGSVSRRDPWYQGYAERAIHTAVQMIEDAELGTRHHTRLRAARLLGGYVAGGLLSDDQAYGALAQALVDHTEDLQRALKTVEDGLAYGKSHPITVDALEAERQDWLAHHGRTNTLQGGLRTIAAAQVLARGSLRTIQAKEVPPWRS
jgi:VirE N-terminal domain